MSLEFLGQTFRSDFFNGKSKLLRMKIRIFPLLRSYGFRFNRLIDLYLFPRLLRGGRCRHDKTLLSFGFQKA